MSCNYLSVITFTSGWCCMLAGTARHVDDAAGASISVAVHRHLSTDDDAADTQLSVRSHLNEESARCSSPLLRQAWSVYLFHLCAVLSCCHFHGRVLPIMLGGAKPPISGQERGLKGRSPKPKGPRESGVEFLVCHLHTHTHTHTHPFNGPLSRTTWVSRYQKGKTNLDFTEARDSEWQWHQLGYVQVCTSLETDNYASTRPLSFLQAGCPSWCPTNSVKALKALALKNIFLALYWSRFRLAFCIFLPFCSFAFLCYI